MPGKAPVTDSQTAIADVNDRIRQLDGVAFWNCLRCWNFIRAAIQMTAQSIAHSFLEAYQIVGFMVSPDYMESPTRQHYGERLIEAMLQFPEIVDIMRGLEQVYTQTECQQEKQLVERFVASGKQLPGVNFLLAVAASTSSRL